LADFVYLSCLAAPLTIKTQTPKPIHTRTRRVTTKLGDIMETQYGINILKLPFDTDCDMDSEFFGGSGSAGGCGGSGGCGGGGGCKGGSGGSGGCGGNAIENDDGAN